MGKLTDFISVGPTFKYIGRIFGIKSKENYPNSTNLKLMHGINRVSIVMFVFAIIVLVFRYLL